MKLLDNSTYLEDIIKVCENNNFSFLRNKSILITGGLGLIGSAVVDILLFLNSHFSYNIMIYVCGRNFDRFNNKYGDYQKIDFIQYDAMYQFNFPKCDYYVLGAGITSPDQYVVKPYETIITSLMGVQSLKENGLADAKCIYISSSEVYGQSEDEVHFEDDFLKINLRDIRASYSVGKVAAEMICKALVHEYGFDIKIARPGHVFGPSSTFNDQRISSSFLHQAVLGNDLILLSDGLQKRSYCYSLDCAASLIFILEYGESGDIYNIGALNSMSIFQFAQYVAKYCNVNLIIRSPEPSKRIIFNPMKSSVLDSKKLTRLGFKYSFTTLDALDHTLTILGQMYKKGHIG